MPEVAFHKDGNTAVAEYEIRPARKIADMKLGEKAEVRQHCADCLFWARVAAPDPRHHCAACFRAHCVAAVQPDSLASCIESWYNSRLGSMLIVHLG